MKYQNTDIAHFLYVELFNYLLFTNLTYAMACVYK